MTKKTKEKIICVIDTETTGRRQDGGEIIELGAVKYSYKSGKAKILGRFFGRIRPRTDYFNPQALAVNRIDPVTLKNKPLIEEIFPEFLNFIKGSILVVHRAGFDVDFIRAAIKECKLPVPNNWVCDTAKMGSMLFKKRNLHLEDMLREFRIKRPFGRHKSWIDCVCTGKLFFKMARGYKLSELGAERFKEVKFRKKYDY
ncbi:3'-5' exonuclease [bacterium]|nr:3'-5' exonuclease [bacterium]